MTGRRGPLGRRLECTLCPRRDDCEIGDRHGDRLGPIGTTVPGTTVPMGPLAQAILALV